MSVVWAVAIANCLRCIRPDRSEHAVVCAGLVVAVAVLVTALLVLHHDLQVRSRSVVETHGRAGGRVAANLSQPTSETVRAPSVAKLLRAVDELRPPTKKGQYVLATKWSDGHPRDHWAIGFIHSIDVGQYDTRYIVVDGEGTRFRCNGFRRAVVIQQNVGLWLLKRIDAIDAGDRSLWSWLGLAICECRKAQGEN
jgi:hypothetical protein